MKLRRQNRPEQGPGGLQVQGAQETWSPLGELARLRHEINRAFAGSAWEDLIAPGPGFLQSWSPSFDLYEEKDHFTLRAEIPGMRKEDIEVSMHGDTLSIAGERKQEEQQKDAEMYRSERYYGRFQRSLTLPRPVDPGKITAQYRDGILTVRLPKTEAARPRQIEVQVS